MGVVTCQEGSISHGVAHHSLGAHSLGENFHNGEAISLSIPLVLRDSSLILVLGTHFCLGIHLPLGETPLGVHLVLGEAMLLRVPPSPREISLP
jgi:hypothetical protein